MDPNVFNHPFQRRALYKRAHSDPALAKQIMETDPLYGQRSKLSKFENTVNDVLVALFLPLGSATEFIIGNILNKIEGQSPTERSRLGKIYDEVVYTIFDPFHRKRLLYDLSSVSEHK